MSSIQLVRAKWVVPVEGPPIENGVLEIDGGRIQSVGGYGPTRKPDVLDLGEVIVLPGLVNAHTHLEMTGYANRVPAPASEGDSFVNWVAEVVRLRMSGEVPAPDDAIVRQGIDRSLRAGVTTVGDISRTNLSWRALKDSAIRKVCFAELISIADQPPTTLPELRAELEKVEPDDRLRVGLSPHAPFTVTEEHLRGCFALAGQRSLPVTMHLAESHSEVAWLGGEPSLIDGFLAMFPGVVIRSPRVSAVEYLRQVGGLDVLTLLAHVNYVDDNELDLLATSDCSVAYCPRTHAYFSHEPHRFAEMLERGINVCVGTDGLASSPSLSILDELRYLRREFPELPGRLLLEMGTIRGAGGLGMRDQVGSLTPGKQADFVAVPVDPQGGQDPVENLLISEHNPTGVWIAGQRVEGIKRIM